jgi:integrase/recombinase XerD
MSHVKASGCSDVSANKLRCESEEKVIIQANPSISEGSSARHKPSGRKPSVVKRRAGRKRRGRSMGRYPFMTWAKKYLCSVGDSYAPSTVVEMERRYRQMDREFRALKRSRRVNSTSPEKISPEDVLAYVNYQKKDKRMKESGILHNLGPLNNLLAYAGNPAVTIFKQKFRSSVPKKRSIRYPTLEEDLFQRILQEANRVKEDDWRRLKAYALVTLALSTGMRNKEIRFCKVADLDLKHMQIRAERVKGEGTYGQARSIAIRPEAHGILEKYLKLRSKKVAKKCLNNQALFPALRDDGDGYYSSNGIRMIKSIVEKEIGKKFDLRACRRTYGQKAIDEGLDLDAVSVLMGHNTTKTTETYYCRKRQETAIREAQDIWTQSSGNPGVKTPKIESKFEVTGYA